MARELHIWPDEFWPIMVFSDPAEATGESRTEVPAEVIERYEASMRALAVSQREIALLINPDDPDICPQLRGWLPEQ